MTDFLSVAREGDIPRGGRKVVDVDDHEVLLTDVDGKLYATDNICTCLPSVVGHHARGEADDPHTHGGRLARLQSAEVRGASIVCPEHESVFDLATGKPVSGFAEIPLNTYEVRQEEGEIRVARMPDCERHFWNDAGEELRP